MIRLYAYCMHRTMFCWSDCFYFTLVIQYVQFLHIFLKFLAAMYNKVNIRFYFMFFVYLLFVWWRFYFESINRQDAKWKKGNKTHSMRRYLLDSFEYIPMSTSAIYEFRSIWAFLFGFLKITASTRHLSCNKWDLNLK